MLKIPNKMKGVINTLMAVYTPNLIKDYIKNYGLAPVYHSFFQDHHHYQNGWGSNHYGFRDGNIYLEKQHMKDIRAKARNNINTYLKLENKINSCQYNIQKLSHSSKTPTKSTIHTYSLLISGADGMIAKDQNNKPVISDKRNYHEIYNLYQEFKRKLSKYINRHAGCRTLLLDFENPFHYHKHIYSHPHMHGLISATSTKLVKKFENKANELFTKIFEYEPVKKCNIQPTYNSLNRIINYFLQDGKIQIKDTDKTFFNGNKSKLRINQLHLAFNAQLNSTKGHRVAYYVANSTIRSMKKKLNELKVEIKNLDKKNKLIAKKQSTYKTKSMKLKSKENTNTFHSNYANSIIINYIKISQNKKANSQSAQFNKYSYKYTTSGIPP